MRALYPIQDPDNGFFTAGHTNRGEQLLIGRVGARCYEVAFDQDGNLLNVSSEPLPDGPAEDRFSVQGHQKLAEWLRARQASRGARPGTIRVRPFRVADLPIGIEHRPEWHEAFLKDPLTEPNPDNREKDLKFVRRWQDEGMFIFLWGRDYWMNGDGSVHST